METLQLKETTSSLFGIQISTIKKLSGYDNENYLLKCGNKKKYILKKYNFSKENLSLIQAHKSKSANEICRELAKEILLERL